MGSGISLAPNRWQAITWTTLSSEMPYGITKPQWVGTPIHECCLTHWGQGMHICVNKIITIGSDNGLSPVWRQTIIWTNAGLLSIRTLTTNFSEILIKIRTFSLTKIHLNMSSSKSLPFYLSLNVLSNYKIPVLLQSVNWTALLVFHGYFSPK